MENNIQEILEKQRIFFQSGSILKKSNLFDIPLRYPPFGNKLKLLKRIMK